MDAPQINPATKKEIRQYADLVIYRFQMLNKKYDSNYREGALDSDTSDFDPDTSDSDPDTSESDGFNPTQDELPQDEADPAAEVPSNLENHSEGLYDPEDYPPQGQLTKTGAWDQLNSTLLPLLTDLITNMHVCLDPARLLKDPAVNLSLVLELQPRLDHTLHQIKHAINILCPKRESDSWRRELHPQKFKSSRLLPLKVALKENLWGLTSSLIREFCRDIKALGLSYPYFRSRYDSGDWRWKPASTSDVLAVIALATEFLQQSEFELVQRDWPDKIFGMDDMLRGCQEWIYRRHKSIPASLHPVPEGYVQLAQSLLPIIKLSRLFFHKVSTYGKKSLPFFTEMHSDQLELIQHLPQKVLSCLGEFLKYLQHAPRLRPGHWFFEKAKSLEDSFESPLLIISHHFIILISDSDSVPEHNSFNKWYMTWCKQFNLAMQNLKRSL